MDIGQAFKMAYKSLMGSKLRSLLTMLGIIIGVASVITIMSIGTGMTNMISDSFSDLGANMINVHVWGRGSGRQVTPEDMYKLSEDNPDMFTAVSPMVGVDGKLKCGSETFNCSEITGVSEDFLDINHFTVEQGRFLQYIDVKREQKVCVVGSRIAKEVMGGNAYQQKLKIAGEDFTVIGVLEEKANSQEYSSDDVVFLPYTTANKLGDNAFVYAYVFCAASEAVGQQAYDLINETLYEIFQSSDYYYIQNMSEMLKEISAMQGTVVMVLAAIAGISLVVGGIGIMNIMLVSVTERTREIGIRKSLGARRRDIRSQFLIEAGCTSAIGGTIGIALGTGLGYAIGPMLELTISPPYSAIILAFGVSVAIGVIFGYLPANKAAKLNPIDALRYD